MMVRFFVRDFHKLNTQLIGTNPLTSSIPFLQEAGIHHIHKTLNLITIDLFRISHETLTILIFYAQAV